ncbi:MAG: hypothetical protein Q4P30_00230 [Eubacteriales bacterium]|nr:hypothetical protein [Eubacteriales bacterium]
MNKEKMRQTHFIWTLSGRYNIKPRSILFEEDRQEDLDELRLMVIGGLYRYIPQAYLDDYLLRIVGLGESTKYYVELLLCLAQEYVMPRLSVKRRLLPEIERNHVQRIYNAYANRKITSERDKLTYAYFADKIGMPLKSGTDAEVARTIRRAAELGNATEWMKFLYSIFDMYLGGVPKKYESTGHWDEESHQLNAEVLKKAESNIYDDDEYTGDAMVLAAEFNHNVMEEEVDAQLEVVDELKLFSTHADSKVMFDKILANYGPSKFTDRQRIELEKALAVDIHKGCKVHYAASFMTQSRGYKKEYIAEQYEANLRYYEEHAARHEMNIKQLVGIIREKILTDLEETYFNLDRGIPDRRKMYRYVVLKDNKVFMKHVKDTIGSIALTILIDSSGSQLARQKQVASWAYILTQAFSLCGILPRVVGFNNLFDYTVLREYRDFTDPISKNKDVFYFTAEGSNRDGMAIKTMDYLMKSRPQEKKLMLVLSDGKPNDVRIGVSTHIVSGHDTLEYTGINAIEDTAKVVRRARAGGVQVMGIYTGERDEIYSQKLIYGKEFAYVPDLNEMGKIVGRVIEKVIKDEAY